VPATPLLLLLMLLMPVLLHAPASVHPLCVASLHDGYAVVHTFLHEVIRSYQRPAAAAAAAAQTAALCVQHFSVVCLRQHDTGRMQDWSMPCLWIADRKRRQDAA
jgi:hypothetical protein